MNHTWYISLFVDAIQTDQMRSLFDTLVFCCWPNEQFLFHQITWIAKWIIHPTKPTLRWCFVFWIFNTLYISEKVVKWWGKNRFFLNFIYLMSCHLSFVSYMSMLMTVSTFPYTIYIILLNSVQMCGFKIIVYQS